MRADVQLEEAISTFKSTLETYGIDIVQPLSLIWYNECLPEHARASQIPLPPSTTATATTSENNDDALTLLIGNSKAIWPKFLACCASDPSILNHTHPLNAYIERSIDTALETAAFFSPLPSSSVSSSPLSSHEQYKIYWSHTTANLRGGEGFVAMQRMAECAGLAYLDHTCHLSFHPTYGPWFSLRCAIVFSNKLGNLDCSLEMLRRKPTPLPCPLSEETMLEVKAAAEVAFSSNDDETMKEKLPGMKDVRAGWEKWLAVRDTAAPGHPYRYSNDQILYHYTGDRKLLRELALSGVVE